MKWLFNPCRRHQENISLLATGALAEEQQAGLKGHLTACPACQARFAELKALAGRCKQLVNALPQVETSVALRRRWMTSVRELARPQNEIKAPILVAWLSGRRLAWGSLAAMWVLVLYFHFSSPDASMPALVAAQTPSLREVLLVLKVERREPPLRSKANQPDRENSPQPDALSPRGQRPDGALTIEMEAV